MKRGGEGMGKHHAAVRGLLEAFWSKDWGRVMASFAEEASYEDPLLPGPVRGKEAILQVFQYCHEWGSYRGEITNIFGGDNFAVAELRIRGTVRKPPEGMPESVVGKSFDFVEADVFEFNSEGKIIRETIYADALTLMRQLGQAP